MNYSIFLPYVRQTVNTEKINGTDKMTDSNGHGLIDGKVEIGKDIKNK